jgi:ribosome-binding factor A
MTDRAAALSEHTRQIISLTLYFQVSDPNLQGITVTRVKVSPDLQFADVRFTHEGKQSLTKVLTSLEKANGIFRKTISREIKLKRVPQLRFHQDTDVIAERRIGDILDGLDIPPAPENDAD